MTVTVVAGVPLDTTTVENVAGVKDALLNCTRVFGSGITEDSITGYSVASGNNAFGSETLLLDTGTTPVVPGKTHFVVKRVGFIAVSSTTPYLIRLIYGTGTVGDAETAKQYTTFGIYPTGSGSNLGAVATEITFPRIAAGTKVWVKCKNATNAATVTLLIGIIEY